MTANKYLFLFAGIVLLAMGLRFYHLPQQGLIFSDEGAMVVQADRIWHNVFDLSSPRKVPQSFLNAKVLWLFLVGAFQRAFHIYTEAGQILSFVFGTLTVGLLFVFVRAVSGCRRTAAWSALLLALSPDHIFYSRLGMPEAAAGLVLLGSMFFFSTGAGAVRSGLFSGMLAGANIFLLKYRSLVFLFFLPVMGMAKGMGRGEILKRLCGVAAGMLTMIFMLFALIGLIRSTGTDFPPLRKAFLLSMSGHKAVFDPFSLITYPFYLWKYETPLIALLFFGAIFIRSAPRFVRACWVIVVFQMVIATFADEKSFRSIAPVLPFFVVPPAWVLKEMWERVSASTAWKTVLIIVVLANAMAPVWQVINYHSDMGGAVRYVLSRSAGKKILTTDGFVAAAYTHISLVAPLYKTTTAEGLEKHFADGYEYMIVNPAKFIRTTRSGEWNDHLLTPLMTAIERECVPVKVYPNFSRPLFERFAWELTRPTFGRTVRLLQNTDNKAGEIRIYSIGECLPRLRP